ncbi:bidirectional sugar transporter SWEET16 [Zea mays]|uniref:Bidirectional sugar transporter SWEET n=1 Tax=Zea mays TaxID=4577 RepID=B6TMZ7_MAIZE|nr:bidirectional sugar transporter SWEET16 [Zea mays]ACG38480.1 cytochrome c oxidoreductase [Zea mays]|eukprot:NP_001288522.1 bidirectional sugar transporter SWEET16 [Zea mays]
MADPSFLVGIVGNVISILVFASPIATFRRIVRSRSTEDFRWLPYVTTLLSTSLWTFYGLLKPGCLLVVTVNGAGAALEAAYVALYLVYAPRETKAKMAKVVVAVNVAFLAAVVAVALLALHGGARLFAVGLLCAALTVGMYAAPLGAMRTVVKTRSVEYMPFSLSFFLFLNGGVWSIYSLLVKDYFIGVPNAIGLVLGTAQLLLYLAYRKAPASKDDDEEAAAAASGDDGDDEEEEEGLTHLMGQQVEMAQRGRLRLHKGQSLPKPPPGGPLSSPRHGFGSIIKSLSATPVELHSVLYQHARFQPVKKDDDDVEAND